MDRIFYVILFGLCLLQLSYAQHSNTNQTLSYTANGTPIKDLILEIESKYQLKFSYASTSIPDVPIHGEVSDLDVEDALAQLFHNTGLEFKIIDDVILLRKNKNYKVDKSNEAYTSSLHIKGKVGDENKPMEFANISVANTSIGTYTDENGIFDIEIPSNYLNENLVIQYLGYEDAIYNIRESQSEFLLVSLKNSPFLIEQIEIVNKPKPIRINNLDNALIINPSANNASGLVGNDIAKMIQNQSGVDASDDASADIKIRGGNSDETLVIIDGIPIYEPSHYYGIFSSINPNYVDKISLYKNNLPIQYGGKTAGVVEIKSSDQIPEKFNAVADINLLNASVNFELPIGQKLALMVSGRSTYTDVSNTKFNSFSDRPTPPELVQNFSDSTLLSVSDPLFAFRDVNAKVLFKPSINTTLSANFYNTTDDFIDTYDVRRRLRDNKGVDLSYNKEDSWSNQGASLILNHQLNSALALNADFFYTSYDSRSFLSAKLQTRFDKDREQEFSMNINNELQELGGSIGLTKTFNSGHKLLIGTSYKDYDLKYGFNVDNKTRIRNTDQSYLVNPYMEFDLSLGENLRLKAGARGNYFSLPSAYKFSPRLQLNYKASDGLNIKSAFSINHQFIRELDFEFQNQDINFWVADNGRRIPSLSSTNTMVGFTKKIGPLILDVELYNKDMTGVLAYILTNPNQPIENISAREYEIFEGVGYSRGVDLLLSSSYKKYDSYLSYTYSKTYHSFDQINKGEYFPAEIDRRHQLKWINEYSLGSLTFGANFIYSSGKPYRDFERISSNPLKPVFKFLPAYERFDLSARYDLEFMNWKSAIGISLINAFDNKNVKYIQSVNSLPDRTGPDKTSHIVIGNETSLLSRTLNINWSVKF